jgi:hypothetical protein
MLLHQRKTLFLGSDMLALGVLLLIIGGDRAPLTLDSSGSRGQVTPPDSVVRSVSPAGSDTTFSLTQAVVDTPRTRRPRAIEVSEWYSRRLTIHRYVAYATIPVFAVQWAAGDRLYKHGSQAPTWAKTMHRVGATTLAGMFTVNTVTGAWNWWDSRSVAQGRVFRTLHGLAILGADVAFTYAGAKLSNEAETSSAKRREHRTVALSAMGVTVVSGLAMKFLNR